MEWTSEHGIEKLNEMLMRQYNKRIDPQKKVGSAQDQFMRMSTAFTPEVGWC